MRKLSFIIIGTVLLAALSGCVSVAETDTFVTDSPQTINTPVTIHELDTDTEAPISEYVKEEQPTLKLIEEELKPSANSQIIDEEDGEIDSHKNSHVLKVHFLDVGQADSILIQSGKGKVMLIDAGNNDDGNKVVSYIRSQGVSKIDILVGTHPHEDHIGGLDTVINAFDIGNIYMPKVAHNTKTFEDVLNAVKYKGLKVTTAKAGVNIDFDPDLKAEFLAPNSDTYKGLNDYSSVIKLTYGNTSFLFTGDAESTSEHEMTSKGYDLKADLLKVGHHGSGTSTTALFLKKVSPKYAVISVGEDNSYGHPDNLILNRLKTFGIEVFRTDMAGTIIAISDGETIKLDKKASAIKENAPPTPTPRDIEIQTTTVVNVTPTTTPEPIPTISPTPEQIKSENALPQVVYIGNKNTKKFHRSSCSSLPAPKNQVIFDSREEAINAGYEPCKRCNP